MNPQDNQNIPSGHKPILNGNPENCPYLQINQKADEKFKEINIKTSTSPTKEKNDSDSDLSDDESQGTQGSCPFMPNFKKRNPDLGHFIEGYEFFIIKYIA